MSNCWQVRHNPSENEQLLYISREQSFGDFDPPHNVTSCKFSITSVSNHFSPTFCGVPKRLNPPLPSPNHFYLQWLPTLQPPVIPPLKLQVFFGFQVLRTLYTSNDYNIRGILFIYIYKKNFLLQIFLQQLVYGKVSPIYWLYYSDSTRPFIGNREAILSVNGKKV